MALLAFLFYIIITISTSSPSTSPPSSSSSHLLASVALHFRQGAGFKNKIIIIIIIILLQQHHHHYTIPGDKKGEGASRLFSGALAGCDGTKKTLSQICGRNESEVSLWLMTAGVDEMRSGGGALYTTSL